MTSNDPSKRAVDFANPPSDDKAVVRESTMKDNQELMWHGASLRRVIGGGLALVFVAAAITLGTSLVNGEGSRDNIKASIKGFGGEVGLNGAEGHGRALFGVNKVSNNKLHYVSEGGVQGEWIIVANENYFAGEFDSADCQNIVGTRYASNVFTKVFKGCAATLTNAEAADIASRPDVDYVEQNSIMTVDQSTTWGIDRMDQRDLPLDNSYSPDGDGSGVTVYIIDTGIQTSHEEFGDRATWGINLSGDGEDLDCHGHGTHVAGTVGGAEYGVAKNVDNLVAVKVLQCSGSGTTINAIAGLEWVHEDAEGKRAVANMSLGGGFSRALNAAVAALSSNVLVVASAGNDSADACNRSPASEPLAITVGSTTSSDARSLFSNIGTCVDIFAPGSGITSAWIGSDSSVNTISGTSMAAPHVAGLAANLRSSMTHAAATSEIINRATVGKVTNAGAGSPNRLAYAGAVGPTPPPTPAPPTPPPTPCSQANFRVEITTDDHPLETSWDLSEAHTGASVASRGDFVAPRTAFDQEECIPRGEYIFTINDSYGDGLCCDYGGGGYNVYLDGNLVQGGGEFGSSESISFSARYSWTVCGKAGQCGVANAVDTWRGTARMFRCCSDGKNNRNWVQRAASCPWALTPRDASGSCHLAKSFSEAESVCRNRNARLCTKTELEDGCTQGTGCGFDDDYIWSSTDGNLLFL